jgi:hypothetical protein
MKLGLAALASAATVLACPAATVLASPAAASAANLRLDPAKPCFGTGDRLNFIGTGFTPRGIVDFTRDGDRLRANPPIRADASGTVNAGLTVLKRHGRIVRTYAARDRSDPRNRASVRVTVSEATVRIRPATGRPARLRRIAAVGFTTGRTLWAHVVRMPGGRALRNVRIGRLRGACHRLRATRRLFRGNPPTGRYLIQFDTRRTYRRNAPQRDRYRFTVTSG